MESRTWLAIILCFFIWFGWTKWFAPPPAAPSASETSTASTEASAPTAAAPAINELFNKNLVTQSGPVLNNGKLNVAFSDLGGRIDRVELLGYRETIRPDSKFITTIDPAASNFSLSTLFSENALRPLTDGDYKQEAVSRDALQYKKSLPNGVTLVKEYRVPEALYSLEMKYRLSFPKSDRRNWGYLLIPLGSAALQHDHNNPLQSWEVVFSQNDSLTRENVEKLKREEVVHQGTTNWMAFGNRYFSSALVNGSAINPDVVLLSEAKFSGAYLRYPLQLKEGQQDLDFSLQLYSGPKDLKELTKYKGLKQLVDYGMFSFLAYPLVQILKFFYGYVHNYGVAIILLTILVRLLFYPLSLQGYRSMKNMQKLQPQIAAMKEKYKDDRDRMNREQMALFKTHKVNPAGGCLPMLVQLPVFIALYAVLGNSIELFHSPFFGWIQDLSSKDPYYIYPVLMGLAMLGQQKLTPTVGMDPTQAKMMYLMPVIFTFIMLNLPSGLTVYIFISTLLGIVQQLSMTKERKGATPVSLTPVPSPEGSPKKA